MVLFFSLCVNYNKESFLYSGENANNLEFKELAVLLDKVDFFKHYVKSLSLLSVFTIEVNLPTVSGPKSLYF